MLQTRLHSAASLHALTSNSPVRKSNRITNTAGKRANS